MYSIDETRNCINGWTYVLSKLMRFLGIASQMLYLQMTTESHFDYKWHCFREFYVCMVRCMRYTYLLTNHFYHSQLRWPITLSINFLKETPILKSDFFFRSVKYQDLILFVHKRYTRKITAFLWQFSSFPKI